MRWVLGGPKMALTNVAVRSAKPREKEYKLADICNRPFAQEGFWLGMALCRVLTSVRPLLRP